MMRHRNALHHELRLEQQSVIATATDTVTATIAVDGRPLGGAVSPEGGTVYFANAGSKTVSVIAAVTYIPPTPTESRSVTSRQAGLRWPIRPAPTSSVDDPRRIPYQSGAAVASDTAMPQRGSFLRY